MNELSIDRSFLEYMHEQKIEESFNELGEGVGCQCEGTRESLPPSSKNTGNRL